MRVGLISDTHIPWVAERLPREVLEAFRGVDLILHAGDIYVPSVLDELNNVAPVCAALGDGDYGDTLTDGRVRTKHIVRLKGQIVLLIHERQHFNSYAPAQISKYPEQEVCDSPDIVVFGHEHRPVVQRYRGVLLVNPGSPTLPNYKRGRGTIGILDIGPGGAEVNIVQL